MGSRITLYGKVQSCAPGYSGRCTSRDLYHIPRAYLGVPWVKYTLFEARGGNSGESRQRETREQRNCRCYLPLPLHCLRYCNCNYVVRWYGPTEEKSWACLTGRSFYKSVLAQGHGSVQCRHTAHRAPRNHYAVPYYNRRPSGGPAYLGGRHRCAGCWLTLWHPTSNVRLQHADTVAVAV
jgi:hypothetical protein